MIGSAGRRSPSRLSPCRVPIGSQMQRRCQGDRRKQKLKHGLDLGRSWQDLSSRVDHEMEHHHQQERSVGCQITPCHNEGFHQDRPKEKPQDGWPAEVIVVSVHCKQRQMPSAPCCSQDDRRHHRVMPDEQRVEPVAAPSDLFRQRSEQKDKRGVSEGRGPGGTGKGKCRVALNCEMRNSTKSTAVLCP